MIRNPTELQIPFENGKLEFSWGWTFYLCLVNGKDFSRLRPESFSVAAVVDKQVAKVNTKLLVAGAICIIIAVVIFVLYTKCPEDIQSFLGADHFNDYDEYYLGENNVHIRQNPLQFQMSQNVAQDETCQDQPL